MPCRLRSGTTPYISLWATVQSPLQNNLPLFTDRSIIPIPHASGMPSKSSSWGFFLLSGFMSRAQLADGLANKWIKIGAPRVEIGENRGAHAGVPEFLEMISDRLDGLFTSLGGKEL